MKDKRQQKFRHQVWCMAFAPYGSEGYTQCETPSGTPWSLRRYLLKIHTFPLPPQTLLLCPVAGQLCFLSASGWSVQEQFLLPWPFSFHPVHGHALVCYRHHPNYFPLDSWRALQRSVICGVSHVPSQGSFRTAYYSPGAAGLPASETCVDKLLLFLIIWIFHTITNAHRFFSSETDVKIWVTWCMIYQGYDKQPSVAAFWIWSEHLF